MTRFINILVSINLLAIGMISCESLVDFDESDHDDEIVINSVISPENPLNIHLSKSNTISGSDNFENITSREIKVYEESIYKLTLAHNSDGNYDSKDFYPEIGKNYKIEVYKKGQMEAWASTQIPLPTEILSSEIVRGSSNSGQVIEISFKDPVEVDNFYRLSILEVSEYFGNNNDSNSSVNSMYKSFSLAGNQNLISSSDGLENEITKQDNYKETHIFSDEVINGKEYNLKVGLNSNFNTDADRVRIILHFCTLHEDYFNNIESILLFERLSGIPLIEPVKVYSNINNGSGIFASYSISTDTIIVK